MVETIVTMIAIHLVEEGAEEMIGALVPRIAEIAMDSTTDVDLSIVESKLDRIAVAQEGQQASFEASLVLDEARNGALSDISQEVSAAVAAIGVANGHLSNLVVNTNKIADKLEAFNSWLSGYFEEWLSRYETEGLFGQDRAGDACIQLNDGMGGTIWVAPYRNFVRHYLCRPDTDCS